MARTRYAKPGPVSGRRRVIILVVLLLVSAAAGAAWARLGPPVWKRVSDIGLKSDLDAVLAQLKAECDPRLTVLEVSAAVDHGVVTLSGRLDAAKHGEVLDRLRRITGVRSLKDKTLSLPDPALGARTEALVSVAVADLGDAPGRHEGEHLVTQARLGDVLQVLREENGWYLVRMTDDGYLGWLPSDSLRRKTPAEVEQFLSGPQVLVTAKFAEIRSAEGGAVLTAVMGTRLPLADRPAPAGAVAVRLPDGSSGFLDGRAVRIEPSALAVAARARPAQDIIALAEQFLGLAYLWGGTTSYGFDCSGFVQFVFGMNGYSLPRDADMQFSVGRPVESRVDLRPGDLVFFSTYKAGPSHVGIYIGDGRFIHAGSAGVAINSFDPNRPDYSEKLDKAYIGARRIIGVGE